VVNTKDLRDIFDDLKNEASKRAGDAMSDVNIGRRDETPGFLFFVIGLAFGTLIGVLAAFLMTPYRGEEARQKVAEQVEKIRKRDEVASPATNGGSVYTSTPTGTYERS
jgi:hypothetical protein